MNNIQLVHNFENEIKSEKSTYFNKAHGNKECLS